MDKRIIELKDISFRYEKINVIDDISISFAEGKFYGILGPNGCGKTTLLDIITNYKKPYKGDILIRGEHIAHYSKNDISKLISIVPQDFYINFPFTVEEIVNMGRYPYISRFSIPSRRDLEIVNKTIEDLQLSEVRYKYMTQLSGGERQRVVFARALAQDTPIILIDEGTSNLDIKHAVHILNHVKNIVTKKNKTVIAVFHNLNLASLYCDFLIFMKSGKIVTHGDTGKVFIKEIVNRTFDINCHIYVEKYTGKKQIIFKKDFICL